MIRLRLPLLLVVPLIAALSGCGFMTDRLISKASGMEVIRAVGESMEPTIKKNSLVTVRTVRGGYAPKVGDIVLFDAAQWGIEGSILQRVIGVPGSFVQCCDADGRQLLNGNPLEERYLPPDVYQHPFGPVTVPAGRLWIQGDNRRVSLDSRSHLGAPGGGTIAVSDVIGVVELDAPE
ncbi:signal peptidase I [Planomonospora algeriensis]